MIIEHMKSVEMIVKYIKVLKLSLNCKGVEIIVKKNIRVFKSSLKI